MYGWRNTSDPSALIQGLHRQPVLAVLRPRHIHEARHQLQLLQQAGLRHVELAVQAEEVWVGMARSLVIEFPGLRLGAASVCTPAGLQAAIAAGLGYVVSPILDPQLLQQAADASITLVPGVFSPSEVAAAVRWGASAVKLYPAASLGSAYWRSLAGPLHPLPFCIAAGGLSIADVPGWIKAGVDAVALGSTLFSGAGEACALRPGLPDLLTVLSG
jgi:2-dehydro-3-deoxyphosphogluconate aldolase / (4S)-4-hydroxy-2-oxoglutarate aldolase